ncbi:MAG TPA: alpha/beta hydrolase [Stenotrophobium sp.]|jgi:pimeloyl-ACP methyl ester carboxylesterase|nr:alpha/beta hydrolase [Stenotrophobium sp.]
MPVDPQREQDVPKKPPSPLLLLLEGRVVAEFGGLLASLPLLRRLPRGDGHAVMVVPGFGADDRTTAPLRHVLSKLGYDAQGWGLGRNLGMRAGMKEKLGERLRALHDEHGGKVSLIGWSLGGVFVREMARAQPHLVRRVFTLGSPINGHPDANNMTPIFRYVNRGKPMKLDWDGFQRRRVPPPVPCVAIYSRTDGIVEWHCSREETADNTENVEVFSSHFGLPFNPLVVRALAARLRLP